VTGGGDPGASYDRRWAAYTRRSLALLRPWIAGRSTGAVLDVGCGTGSLLPRLAAWGATVDAYAGVDPDAAMLATAGARIAAAPFPAGVARAGAGALPFRDASFDLAVTASSLHAWPDPGAGLAELRRVLRSDGTLMLLDGDARPLPMRALRGWMRLRGIPFGRMHRRGELRAMLATAGLRPDAEVRGTAGGGWRLVAFRARPV
jgi:ubiquinone/menaquinone biosynthesis C-methylase UbiE